MQGASRCPSGGGIAQCAVTCFEVEVETSATASRSSLSIVFPRKQGSTRPRGWRRAEVVVILRYSRAMLGLVTSNLKSHSWDGHGGSEVNPCPGFG